jgi:hypothetical protein
MVGMSTNDGVSPESRKVTTLFWTHSLFDAGNPDTYWEPVADVAKADA